MKQYNQIKGKYPDALLLFRVGDFYETFGKDAVRTAKILGIILTKRGAGSSSETELAGFPHHALPTYLPKLVRAGERVAICDQLEDPKMTKTIVKRGVTELITPGVALTDGVLEEKSNNFLASIHIGQKHHGLAILDISTGEFQLTEGLPHEIATLLQQLEAKEILVAKPNKKRIKDTYSGEYPFYFLEDWVYQLDFALEKLQFHFGTTSLKGFGVSDLHQGICAAGAIFYYLSETEHARLSHITQIKRIGFEGNIWMDRFTIRNLELIASNAPQAVPLIDVIDYTHSPMGGRMLKRWITAPLSDKKAIEKRLNQVSFLKEHPAILDQIQTQIKAMGDLERLVAKVATSKVSPRELNQLKDSLLAVAQLRQTLQTTKAYEWIYMVDSFDPCDDLTQNISNTLKPDAPVNMAKGESIAEGVSEELDELRSIAQGGKQFLDDMLTRESERTQIPSLKIAFNNVFGYYIEVRNTHREKVPEEWIRKQTLVNAERYITEELKAYETKILGAEEKIAVLEQQLFAALIQEVFPYIKKIQQNSFLVAELDGLAGFATLAERNQYHRPELVDQPVLSIKQGRHPVIEQQLPLDKPYIPNDVELDRATQQIIMITGPNMSGKSAILRQTALIVLMAQMGSFVPAEHVQMGVVDKLFTRVGASDNISMGESTFMVEMNETAAILNNVSERSLILLDEIGRGTSTYDGISIAWAIAEFLHLHPAQPKTLFATHYHELNRMTEQFDRIKNFNVSVKELEDDVVFIRKLVPGGSAHSFGIHVAKMAGMPKAVLSKSKQMLKQLESSRADEPKEMVSEEPQLSFFQLDDPLLEEIRDQILSTDIDTLTPVEALMKLNAIKRMLQKKGS